ncbi:hypothetical protein B0T20DRAFT_116182 [Sordaria brevicollis]|uniref:Secreted protein n=1 Tax=Sordaria brevicollis TaxID=83679 RepID=A0AAE0PKD4_SORBR|nr:hypothetical protein B0T20DRAFT_116182 [Sordaria brevicollis]
MNYCITLLSLHLQCHLRLSFVSFLGWLGYHCGCSAPDGPLPGHPTFQRQDPGTRPHFPPCLRRARAEVGVRMSSICGYLSYLISCHTNRPLYSASSSSY